MSRDYIDYISEDKKSHSKGSTALSDLPLKIELSFKSRDQLKREVWDNARAHGWLDK